MYSYIYILEYFHFRVFSANLEKKLQTLLHPNTLRLQLYYYLGLVPEQNSLGNGSEDHLHTAVPPLSATSIQATDHLHSCILPLSNYIL